MKNIIALLFILIMLTLSIPVHDAPYHADQHPCIVNGVDMCERPAPVIPVPVDVSCLASSFLDMRYDHEDSIAESGFKINIPYIPSLKMDKPPRV